MKAKDVFSVAVRIVGLALLYQGLSSVPTIVQSLFIPNYFWRNFWAALMTVGWQLLLAFYMVRGAPLLMRFAYGREDKESNPTAMPVRDKLL